MTDAEKIEAIAAKLAEDSEVAGLSDEAAAARLLAIDPSLATTKRVKVPVIGPSGILLGTGEWAKIGLIAEGRVTAPSPQVLGLCYTVREALTQQPYLSMDTYYNEVNAVLGGLVAAGILAQGTKDSLMALADQPVERSWADAFVEGRHISAEDVAAARGA